MPKWDFGGARGSGLGDDFHELWALRRALELLLPNNDVVALTVEGMLPEDEKGHPSDVWDGVDCTLYYGNETIDEASRVVIDQLKYSGSNPNTNWTISRLTRSTAKQKNNSIFRKLAKAFAAIDQRRSSLLDEDSLTIRLVSNQPAAEAVINALAAPSIESANQQRLLEASGLSKRKFVRFCRALDLSCCGTTELMSLEEGAIRTISQWTGANALDNKDLLLKKIRNLMRPDEKRAAIRKETVASWLGYADPASLFPCPSSIVKPPHIIVRAEVVTIADKLMSGEQFICIHGIGGSGKSTSLFELADRLPRNSQVIIFDCYGAGTYLNSNSFRHRKEDAFPQLTNELASICGMPVFLARAVNDYARAFHSQLMRASDLLSQQGKDALLIIAVDAADNAESAAQLKHEGERCFVPDFVGLGDLPPNVRFIVSARTGRLPELGLAGRYVCHELGGFSLQETQEMVRVALSNVPEEWAADFQHLSNGNPRVQSYALQYGAGDLNKTLDYLRPSGKGLAQVFQEQFEFALAKSGDASALSTLCAALIELPRPIPINDLAVVSGISAARIRDICSDLAPGLLLSEGHISFADEDFEHFVDSNAATDRSDIRGRIVDRFSRNHQLDSYAAENYAQALVAGGLGEDLIKLIREEPEPTAILDPAHRRRVQRQRLRLALRVCRENSETVDATMTILIAAEAMKTDVAIQRIVEENSDLAVSFSPDQIDNIILRNPENQEYQGPVLCYMLAQAARDENRVEARELERQIRSWLDHRDQHHKELKTEEKFGRSAEWDIPLSAYSAVLEARLRAEGWESALGLAMNWRPRSWVFGAVLDLMRRLVFSGEGQILQELEHTELVRRTPWRFAVEVFACLADEGRIPNNLASDLRTIMQRGHLANLHLDEFSSGRPSQDEFVDLILTGCECVVARSSEPTSVVPVLVELANPDRRRKGELYAHQTQKLDVLLRAWSLLETLRHGEADKEQFLIKSKDDESSADSDEQSSKPERKRSSETERELTEYLSAVAPLYVARAHAICQRGDDSNAIESLTAVAARLAPDNYNVRRATYASDMRTRCARSIARLLVVPGLGRLQLLRLGLQIIHPNYFAESHARLISDFAFVESLHANLVQAANERAEAIKSERISADDKVGALLILSRALEPISRDDAGSIFGDAIEVAAEIDQNVMHELTIFETLSGKSIAAMNELDRREVAVALSVVASDAAVRLYGYDGFPWESICRSITKLDVSVALACSARWDDEDTVSRANTLHEITAQGMIDGTITVTQFMSLLPLYSPLEASLLIQALDLAEPEAKLAIANVIARHEMAGGGGPRQRLADHLATLTQSCDGGFWLAQLKQTALFLNEEYQQSAQNEQNEPPNILRKKKRHGTSIEVFDFGDCDATSTESLQLNWIKYQECARSADAYVRLGSFLARVRPSLPRNRIKYLNALTNMELDFLDSREVLTEIQTCVSNWSTAPSIKLWCNSELPKVIIDRFLPATAYIQENQSLLPTLMEATKLADPERKELLMTAIERHADDLGAARLVHLVGFLAQFIDADSVAQIAKDYSRRLRDRINEDDQDEWQVDDIPPDIPEAYSRLIFAYLSDIELGNRWLAAHVLRLACRLGDTETLSGVIACFDRQLEPVFRDPSAPFYWMAARLWLLIAADRIALERPCAVNGHAEFLFAQATNAEFPHILMRQYARSAALKLSDYDQTVFSLEQIDALRSVNRSKLVPQVRSSYDSRPDRSVGARGWDERRFHFDGMDTLPYWYKPAAEVFADLPYEQFVLQAEKWIVDTWGVEDDVWRWDDEKRRQRMKEGMNTLHRHGSLPRAERYNTHLEWHAMWCALGDLLVTHPLRENPEEGDNYGTLGHKLDRAGLSLPPFWLSDFRGPKPLERRFWIPPATDRDGVSRWLEDIEEEAFMQEAGLLAGEFVVLDASHQVRSSEFGLRVNVNAALVAPETASALCRYLQSCESSWDYSLPFEGSESEIDIGEYGLRGMLHYTHDDLNFDRLDPLRFTIDRLELTPGPRIAEYFCLNRLDGPIVVWTFANGNLAFERVAWGETPNNQGEYYRRFESAFRADGHRLRVKQEALREYLNEIGMDLLLEVEIDRKDSGYESAGYGSEIKECTYDRLYILRRDGAIETADGCIGTWTVDC